jgi:hypothetical protein
LIFVAATIGVVSVFVVTPLQCVEDIVLGYVTSASNSGNALALAAQRANSLVTALRMGGWYEDKSQHQKRDDTQ